MVKLVLNIKVKISLQLINNVITFHRETDRLINGAAISWETSSSFCFKRRYDCKNGNEHEVIVTN